MFLVQPPATMLLWVCKTFPKKNGTQKPNSCWNHWSRNGLHPFPFRMRKINGFSHPFRWHVSPCVSRGGETVKMLNQFGGSFLRYKKTELPRTQRPLLWLEKALFWLIDLQKQRSFNKHIPSPKKQRIHHTSGFVPWLSFTCFIYFTIALQVKPTIKRIAAPELFINQITHYFNSTKINVLEFGNSAGPFISKWMGSLQKEPFGGSQFFTFIHPPSTVRRGTLMRRDMATARSTFATGRWGEFNPKKKNWKSWVFHHFFVGWEFRVSPLIIFLGVKASSSKVNTPTNQDKKLEKKTPTTTVIHKHWPNSWFPDPWRVPNIQPFQRVTFPHSISKTADRVTTWKT